LLIEHVQDTPEDLLGPHNKTSGVMINVPSDMRTCIEVGAGRSSCNLVLIFLKSLDVRRYGNKGLELLLRQASKAISHDGLKSE